MRALVLNATYEPLSVVTARRAVVLVWCKKAELVERQDRVWHSEHHTFPVPSVVRLGRYVKVPYSRRVPLTRKAVFARDNHRCQYCNGPAENLDHVLPKAKGGSHTWDNVVASCRRCNLQKGSRLLADTGLSLVRRPQAPNRGSWLYAHGGATVDPLWERYLLAESA